MMMNNNTHSVENETGIVTEIIGEDVLVELSHNNACESCGARVVCTPDNNGKRIFKAENSINARIGQQVKIDENSSLILKITAMQYGIPLFGFIFGLIISFIFNLRFKPLPVELIQFGCALQGLIIFASFSKWIIKKIAKSRLYIFTIRNGTYSNSSNLSSASSP